MFLAPVEKVRYNFSILAILLIRQASVRHLFLCGYRSWYSGAMYRSCWVSNTAITTRLSIRRCGKSNKKIDSLVGDGAHVLEKILDTVEKLKCLRRYVERESDEFSAHLAGVMAPISG